MGQQTNPIRAAVETAGADHLILQASRLYDAVAHPKLALALGDGSWGGHESCPVTAIVVLRPCLPSNQVNSSDLRFYSPHCNCKMSLMNVRRCITGEG